MDFKNVKLNIKDKLNNDNSDKSVGTFMMIMVYLAIIVSVYYAV